MRVCRIPDVENSHHQLSQPLSTLHTMKCLLWPKNRSFYSPIIEFIKFHCKLPIADVQKRIIQHTIKGGRSVSLQLNFAVMMQYMNAHLLNIEWDIELPSSLPSWAPSYRPIREDGEKKQISEKTRNEAKKISRLFIFSVLSLGCCWFCCCCWPFSESLMLSLRNFSCNSSSLWPPRALLCLLLSSINRSRLMPAPAQCSRASFCGRISFFQLAAAGRWSGGKCKFDIYIFYFSDTKEKCKKAKQ